MSRVTHRSSHRPVSPGFSVAVLAGATLAIFATPLFGLAPQAAFASSGVINGDGVDVSDQWSRPGQGGNNGSNGSNGGSGSQGGGSGSGSWLGPYKPGIPWAIARAYCVARLNTPAWCADVPPTDPSEATEPQPGYPDLALADLSHVEPQSPTLTTQPVGWSVVGVDTNLIAHIDTHVVTTRVHGDDVEVRFTPVRYDWDFGDGSTATTDVPGAAWEVFGVAEFAPTPTSHRYMTAAAVTPRVTVSFAVDYHWPDESWRTIAGTLSRDASAPVVFLQNATTVLVTAPCGQSARAPGCR